MRVFLIVVFILAFRMYSWANIVEQYVTKKDGITLFATISAGSIEEKKIQDAFLDQLVKRLKNRDRSIPIFLLTDQYRIFPDRNDWFGAISFDTLRIHDQFDDDYFYYRMGKGCREELLKYSKAPSTKYEIDQKEPINIASTYDESNASVGLKIVYNYSFADSVTGWDRQFTLVQYAIDHINEVKVSQRPIVVPYSVWCPGSHKFKLFVSLLTIDTGLIRNIPLAGFEFDHTKLGKGLSNSMLLKISALVFGIGLGLFLVLRKKRNG